jgi:hypothetical protein
MNARYRVWQFWQALRAKPLTTAARAEVTAVLSEAEVALFSQFSASEQRHSYRVFGQLQEAGQTDPALLKAALLHDVGKVKYPLRLWDRVLVVLGYNFVPLAAAQWAEGKAEGWQRPFVVKARHPQWGAEMAQAAGSNPLTISLIRRHQDKLDVEPIVAEDRLLQQLQWADDRA